MNTRLFLSIFFLAIGWLTPHSAPAQQSLRWKFEPGKSWLVKIDQTSEWQTTVGGKTSVSRLDGVIEASWHVKSLSAAGEAVLEQRISRVSMKKQSPKYDTVEYDSAATEKPKSNAKPVVEAVAPLLGAVLTVRMTPQGKMSEPELKLPENAKPNTTLESFVKGNGLQDLLRHSPLVLPESSVKPGDTWEERGKIETLLGVFQQTTKYELQSAKADDPHLWPIAITTQFEKEKSAHAAVDLPLVKSHSREGTIIFDHQAGRLRSSEITQKLHTISTRKDAAVEVRLTNTITMTLTPQ